MRFERLLRDYLLAALLVLVLIYQGAGGQQNDSLSGNPIEYDSYSKYIRSTRNSFSAAHSEVEHAAIDSAESYRRKAITKDDAAFAAKAMKIGNFSSIARQFYKHKVYRDPYIAYSDAENELLRRGITWGEFLKENPAAARNIHSIRPYILKALTRCPSAAASAASEAGGVCGGNSKDVRGSSLPAALHHDKSNHC